MEDMAKAIGFVHINPKTGKEKNDYSRLSQLENEPKGPPLGMVEKYAQFFNLKGEDKLHFFKIALESSAEIRIDITAIDVNMKDIFLKFIAAVLLCDNEAASYGNSDYPFGLEGEKPKGETKNETWKNLSSCIDKFCDAIAKGELKCRCSLKSSYSNANPPVQ
jgi:hypothetical protein